MDHYEDEYATFGDDNAEYDEAMKVAGFFMAAVAAILVVFTALVGFAAWGVSKAVKGRNKQ